MDKLVRRLAYARKAEAEYNQQMAEIKAEIEAKYGERLSEVRRLLDTATEGVANTEVAVRAAAIQRYSAIAQKQVHPAVAIKEFTVLAYEDGDALAYCQSHLPQALKLDKKVFEKAASAINLDFVHVRKEPRATIAKDLTAYLKEDEQSI